MSKPPKATSVQKKILLSRLLLAASIPAMFILAKIIGEYAAFILTSVAAVCIFLFHSFCIRCPKCDMNVFSYKNYGFMGILFPLALPEHCGNCGEKLKEPIFLYHIKDREES